MMGTHSNLALTVLDGLGRWEAGRSACRGHGPATQGLGEGVGPGGGDHHQQQQQQQQQQHQQRGEDTPPKAARTKPPKGPQEKKPLRE